MIPYDDLVVALASWRAKQGLPGAHALGAVAAPAPAAMTGSGPGRTAAAPAPRATPPTPAPTPGSGRTVAPPPLALEDSLDVDDEMVDEANLEPEADEFGSAFSALQSDGEDATSIGAAPAPRDSFGGQTDPNTNPTGSSRSGGNRNDDW